MESNREQAERCIEIAAQAFKEYKTQRANNFLNKAERLYPTQEAKDLLEKVREFDNDQHVRRILGCKNHYKVLEVAKDATDKDILVAFKKLALLVHPDKNRAPRAKEAFVKIEEAKKVLSNPIERSSYDLNLSIETDYGFYENNNSFEYKSTGTNDEADEDLNSQNDDPIPKSEKWWEREAGYHLLVLLPVILLILIPAVVWGMKLLFVSPSIYTLTPEKTHLIRRRTVAAKIPYYVTKHFSEELQYYYDGSLRKLELEVKNEYKTKLTHACNKEKKLKEYWLEEAENSFNTKMHERVQRMKTPSCDTLNELFTDSSNQSHSYFSNIFASVVNFLHF
ncbi:dnaJ homolog subfamily B member 12-like [Sitodiplosis mosellana]|uniref:dnaJ homolog subfamily B member 12-like n=1 Tax=Sitodiplosis mosellana TaxID=263140 RepID=UPI0024444A55|nr:dnaJ homolog subfamily B member 12-like [Sitodiplosis mosellana]